MSNDVLITPASRKIEFKDSEGNIDAKIEADASGNLSISNTGGDISIGDTSSDVFIGDGTNSVDIVFEQNGEIRGTSGVTLTLGDSNTTLRTGTDLSLNGNDITNVNDLTITGNLTVSGTTTTLNTSTLQVQDKNIVLNYGTGDTSGSVDGAGITIQDAVNSTTDATILWNASSDRFDFSHKVNVVGDVEAYNFYGQDVHVLNSAGTGWHEWATRASDRVNLSVHGIALNGVVASTNNSNADGPNFNVSTTNKSTSEYAYRVDRSGTIVGGIRIDGVLKSDAGVDLTGSTSAYVNLNNSGFITFYGNSNNYHGIGARNSSGSVSDDIRINSYGAVNINLDSNNNNDSAADFLIGRHGSGTGSMSQLFHISGENGNVTSEGRGTFKAGAGGQGLHLDTTSNYSSGTLNAPGLLWREADGTNIAGIRGFVNSSGNHLSLGTGWLDEEVTISSTGVAVSGTISWSGGSSGNANTAYSWGNHANAGYLTGITSAQVTTALGFTPYNATNPSGYITNSTASLSGNKITSGTINNARLSTDMQLISSAPRYRLQESDVTNTPNWWMIADGGNYSIRLNNTGTYPLQFTTNSSNNAVTTISLGYNTAVNGNITVTGSITTGALSTFSGGTSDYAATFSSTDAYSGIKFQDSDGSGLIYYRGATNHFYLHNSTFAVGGSTLATNFEFQVNGDANITGGIATGGTTRISSSGALSNVTASGDIITSVTTLSDTSWHDVVAFDGSTLKRDTAVELHGSGYLRASYLNMTHSAGTRSSDTVFYSSNDDYIRKTNATGMRAALNVPSRTGGDASGTWDIDLTGPVTVYGQSSAWGEDTQGATIGSIHLDPESTTDNAGSAITWGASDTANGTNAQAGIYVRSDSNYGTRMYISTTDTYSSGSKTAIYIDQAGHTRIKRGNFYVDTGRIFNTDGGPSTPAYSFGNDSDTGIYRNNSNDFGFTTAGSSRFRINDDGLTADSNSNIRGTTDSGIYTYHSSIGGFVLKPGGAQYTTSTSTVTGACKIEFPSAVYAGNDMISFWVDIYDYRGNTTTSYLIGGYIYQTEGNNEWVNVSAMCIANEGNTTTAARTVRFGVQSSKHCVWIGDTDDTWQYPQVVVRDLQAGYATNIDAWADGWAISFATTLGTVDDTIENTAIRIGNEAGDVQVKRDLYVNGNSSRSQIGMEAGGANRGYIYANNSNEIGFLDNSGHWAIRHLNHSGTEFRQNNAIIASIGAGQVSGDYGSMVINDPKNGWSGYSINNRSVFMHDNSNTTGIYNDVDNEWFAKFVRNSASYIYYNGHPALTTTSQGLNIDATDAQTYVEMRLQTNSTTRGYVYANTSNQIGVLDQGGHWAIRHTNDQGTAFYTDNGTEHAAIGADLVSGSFGSMVVKDTKSGWGGYSINNRVVFMHDNANTSGIYNDVNNHFLIKTVNGADVELYYNGLKKLETTSTGVVVTGNITHDGLTMTSGTDIDQLYTVTDSLTLTTSYQDTSINSTELSTGTYIMQLYIAGDHSVGGSHYNEFYSGVISWYGASTNSTEVDEIVLHRAGHAPNSSVIHLRTQRHASGGDNLVLQIKANYTMTAARNYVFKFRRMI